jgi:hypothetical protein
MRELNSESVPMSLIPQSSVDRRIIRSASKYATPEEMSDAVLGQLTPAQCVDRLHHLLNSRTILDEVQERRLLLISMAEHLDWLQSKRGDKDSWAAIGRGYKLLSDQIERTNVNVTDVSTKLAESHAQTYVEAYTMGFNALLKILAERDMLEVEPTLDEVQELMMIGIAESSRYLEANTQKADSNE